MTLIKGVGVPAGAVFDTMELQNGSTFEKRGIVARHGRRRGHRVEERGRAVVGVSEAVGFAEDLHFLIYVMLLTGSRPSHGRSR